MLYEILAGRRAFAAPSVASTLGAILHKTPEPLRAPPALNSIVFKCLSKSPAARFQTATDLQTALTKASHSGNFGVVEPNGPHRFGKLRLIIGGALLAVLGIVALAGGIHWNRIKSAPIDSIAFLPLDMRSTDPEADYISDGIINQDDWSIAPRIAGPKARQAAQKALQLDESNAEAHVVLAIESQWYEWDWAAAEREFKRAIEVSPDNGDARGYYSWFLPIMGRGDEAVAQVKRGLQTDPLSTGMNGNLGSVFAFTHQWDKAIEQLRTSIDSNSP